MPTFKQNSPKLPAKSNEPRYVDIDEDEPNEKKRPKWMIPETSLEKKLFDLYNRLYWQKDEKDLRSKVILISKTSRPMSEGLSKYPTEFIDECIGWVKDSRINSGKYIPLKSLVSAIQNPANLEKFLARWQKGKEYASSRKDNER